MSYDCIPDGFFPIFDSSSSASQPLLICFFIYSFYYSWLLCNSALEAVPVIEANYYFGYYASCWEGFVFFIFFRNMDSKARSISYSLFYLSMYANLVTFLHFFEQLTNSSPMIVNRNFWGTSIFLAIVYSTDSSLSMRGWSDISWTPHNSLEHTDCWQITSCYPIWLSLNGLLHVIHLIRYLLNILVTSGDGVR